ncbi:hypothetical protein FKB34_08895 [Glycocaulis profundi]|nr:hypothetical protein FKB34_08895 [Glycocaulis profundi]
MDSLLADGYSVVAISQGSGRQDGTLIGSELEAIFGTAWRTFVACLLLLAFLLYATPIHACETGRIAFGNLTAQDDAGSLERFVTPQLVKDPRGRIAPEAAGAGDVPQDVPLLPDSGAMVVSVFQARHPLLRDALTLSGGTGLSASARAPPATGAL